MREIDIDTALDWRGRTVVDRDGDKIGTLKDIYLDERERPSWGAVDTGLFAMRQTLIPLGEAQLDDDVLQLPYDGDHVRNAPNVDPDVQLSEDEEQQLYRHYATPSTADDRDAAGAVAAGAGPEDSTEAADDAMTRSEEEVHIHKRRRERGRARLKKYVVTDHVVKKVPVQREEVRLEYEPPDEADRRE
jgi:hypothetical protein